LIKKKKQEKCLNLRIQPINHKNIKVDKASMKKDEKDRTFFFCFLSDCHYCSVPIKMRLFNFKFYVYGVKNTIKYLITHQTVFYTVRPLKNWVWNVVFVKQFLHTFLIEFHKNAICFYVSKVFLKNFEIFLFFSLL